MSLYQRALGNPFVYNHVRPLATGGIDMSPLYRRLETRPDSVVLDIGCGTGDALRYVSTFQRYVGVDTDEVAVRFARERYAGRSQVSFECRIVTAEDIAALAPTHVVMAGLLHHLSDDQVRGLLRDVRRAPTAPRIVTQDIVYLQGKRFSNLLASLDRGRFCRKRPEYEALVQESGFRLRESEIVRCHPRTGLAWYLMMTLEPA